MKNLRLFTASIALTCFSLFPAFAAADELDELDVTFEVLDSVADLDGQVLEMRGPDAETDEEESDEDSDSDGGVEEDRGAAGEVGPGEGDHGAAGGVAAARVDRREGRAGGGLGVGEAAGEGRLLAVGVGDHDVDGA